MIVDVRYYCGWTDGRCYVIIRVTILSLFFKIPPDYYFLFFFCNVCIQFALQFETVMLVLVTVRSCTGSALIRKLV